MLLLLWVVKIIAICNNVLEPPHKGPRHTSIHFYMNIFFKNKTKAIEKKHKPVSPEC